MLFCRWISEYVKHLEDLTPHDTSDTTGVTTNISESVMEPVLEPYQIFEKVPHSVGGIAREPVPLPPSVDPQEPEVNVATPQAPPPTAVDSKPQEELHGTIKHSFRLVILSCSNMGRS